MTMAQLQPRFDGSNVQARFAKDEVLSTRSEAALTGGLALLGELSFHPLDCEPWSATADRRSRCSPGESVFIICVRASARFQSGGYCFSCP
jgi:hypothetical protein